MKVLLKQFSLTLTALLYISDFILDIIVLKRYYMEQQYLYFYLSLFVLVLSQTLRTILTPIVVTVGDTSRAAWLWGKLCIFTHFQTGFELFRFWNRPTWKTLRPEYATQILALLDVCAGAVPQTVIHVHSTMGEAMLLSHQSTASTTLSTVRSYDLFNVWLRYHFIMILSIMSSLCSITYALVSFETTDPKLRQVHTNKHISSSALATLSIFRFLETTSRVIFYSSLIELSVPVATLSLVTEGVWLWQVLSSSLSRRRKTPMRRDSIPIGLRLQGYVSTQRLKPFVSSIIFMIGYWDVRLEDGGRVGLVRRSALSPFTYYTYRVAHTMCTFVGALFFVPYGTAVSQARLSLALPEISRGLRQACHQLVLFIPERITTSFPLTFLALSAVILFFALFWLPWVNAVHWKVPPGSRNVEPRSHYNLRALPS